MIIAKEKTHERKQQSIRIQRRQPHPKTMGALPSLESVIGAKVRDSEERICRLLFKLAVDQNYLAKILARECETYDTYLLEEIRQESIREVKETNGTLRIREHFE